MQTSHRYSQQSVHKSLWLTVRVLRHSFLAFILVLVLVPASITSKAKDESQAQSMVFIKTPKCGGTTMAHCFVNQANEFGLPIYHAHIGGFYLKEAAVRGEMKKLGKSGFGLLYNHGIRAQWMNEVMTGHPRYFGMVRDTVSRARSVIIHGRARLKLSNATGQQVFAAGSGFCGEFKDNAAAIAGCDDLRNNFQNRYLMESVAPMLGHECVCLSYTGRGTKCNRSTIERCYEKQYSLLIPTEFLDEGRALLALDHSFSIPGVLCTTNTQHSELVDKEYKYHREFFTLQEKEQLLKENALDELIHEFAVRRLKQRIQYHGLKFNRTLTRIRDLLNQTGHICIPPHKKHKKGCIKNTCLSLSRSNFSAVLHSFEAQHHCFIAVATKSKKR